MFPYTIITEEMLEEANRLVPSARVNRTIASKIDTLTGHLGEFVVAKYLLGDWRKNTVGNNKGKTDFQDVEVKTSAFPLNLRLNLLVREDYAQKRKPKFYVQVIIDVDSEFADNIPEGTRAYVCGFATSEEVDNAPLKDFGSKIGEKGGYQCRYINIARLHPAKELLPLFKASDSV